MSDVVKVEVSLDRLYPTVSVYYCGLFSLRHTSHRLICDRYSDDEGETWNTVVFSSEKYRIYGVLTEPGEKTTVFSIFGSKASSHSWIVLQVNLSSAIRK